MFRDKLKTLLHVIRMRSIISYNGLVYALKMTPVIGKIIPDALYGTTALKLLFGLVYVSKELFLMFIGKFFGLGMIYAVSAVLATEYMDYDKGAGLSKASLFGNFALMFFIIYALFGIIFNMRIFMCTTEKEYLVFMLKMDARELNNTLFIYELSKLFIGYLIVGIFAALAGAPVWAWLGIPILSIFIKFFGAGYLSFLYKIKRKRGKVMTAGKFFTTTMLFIAIIIFPLTAILVINGLFIPTKYLFIVAAVLVLLGVWGFRMLNTFDTNHHKRALRDNVVKTDLNEQKDAEATQQFKKITAAGSVKESKKGFDFLNSLFVRRHIKILYFRPVAVTLVMAAILTLIICSMIRDYDESIMSFFRYCAQKHLLAMIVPIALGDISFKATQAMYINCDNSLMTFSFFKRRDKIMQLFDIRLKKLIRINAIPAVMCALAADFFLFYTGGQDYPLQYLATIVTGILFGAINSMTGLSMYYLFQPFTKTVNVKSGAYVIVRSIEFIAASIIVWLPVHSLVLLPILAVYTFFYIYVLRQIIRKHAPKSWRIKA